jgi:hypothetical protein
MLQLLLGQVGLLYLVREVVEGWIPLGGQVYPSSIVEDSLLGKNIQKNDTKNRTSETINCFNPHHNYYY